MSVSSRVTPSSPTPLVLSYRDLNRRANQFARHLIAQGIKSGDRVGLLFDKSPETYVAMLAVMKANAAYVPLDAAFPVERLRFIIDDAEISAIVSMAGFEERLVAAEVHKVFLDGARRAIDAEAVGPLTGVAPTYDPLCYIIYTSGTTGNPKGVAIAHASICNFVRVAAELYGYAPGDRVYQGMTIAFDFSVEEIWVPLMAGATLVPGAAGRDPDGRRTRRFPARAQGHRDGLLPDVARDHRAGSAAAAHPAGRRRGLPAKSRGALVSARPPHPQFLWPDRSDRHRDVDRAEAGQARHHRHAAADLFDRHPRSGRGQGRSRPASSAKSASRASGWRLATSIATN